MEDPAAPFLISTTNLAFSSFRMASSFHQCLLLLLLVFFIAPPPSFAKSSFRPKALVIPVTKDASTKQYVTQIHQRTPLVTVKLVVDLGGQHLWVDCDDNYTSSSYRPARCNSAQCSLADASGCSDCHAPPSPSCSNNTCTASPHNTVTNIISSGDVIQDVVSVQSTDGFNAGRNVAVSRFIISCAPFFLPNGLAKGASGMAGLGRTKIALPSQFSSAFRFPRKFAICLSSHSKGVVFLGDGPYNFLPNLNAAQSLTYTPLILNPASASTIQQASSEYFIGVKSIKVNGKVVPSINNFLSNNKKSFGGETMISTVHPYTVLQPKVFKAVAKAFIKASAARNITRVAGVAPFEVCFSKHNVGSTRLGPAVPTIELVLQNNVSWPIFGANSMVAVNRDVLCLGVVNGGDHPWTSPPIVIGGYQLENNLVQFDLGSSRLGFSSLLLGRMTTCANFNFNSAAITAGHHQN